jgi:hypothetical protein
MDQFKSKILLLQRQIEKEDIGAVVFNDQDSGRGSRRRGFQSRLHIALPHSTLDLVSVGDDTCSAFADCDRRSSRSALHGKRWLRWRAAYKGISRID